MKGNYLKLIYALLFLLPFWVQAQTITIHGGDADNYPWHMADGTGLDRILLKMVDKALPEIDIKVAQVPWKRCLINIGSNIIEGCFAASFKEKRKVFGIYPGGDKPDKSRRIHSSSYSLYILKGSNIDVTAKLTISGLIGKVAVPAGYSIGDDLIGVGYKVDAGAHATSLNFEKLLMGWVKGVAALSLNGDNILAKNKKYSDKIRVVKTPLIDKPYYLMFSKGFVGSNKALAEKIWHTLGKERESSEFKEAAAVFLSK